MVAVTGASGFVGGHLVNRLLADGARVRCLVRTSSRLRGVDPGMVEVVRVDFHDEQSLATAVEGCPTIFHVAGATRAGNEEAYRRANEDITRHLVRACRSTEAASERFVLVSSLAAAGPSARDRPLTEDDPPAPVSPYGRSKLAGEIALREEAAALVPWTVVRPAAVYGPADTAFPRLLRMARIGLVARVSGPPQPVSVIHVRDLVEALVLAAREEGAARRVYFAAHPRTTDFDEIARVAAREFGHERVRWFTVPRSLAGTVGRLTGIASALAGRPNPLPPDRLRDLLAPAWCCSPARIEAEVGWTARIGLEAGLADTLSWYRREGWL
jgi:nucleoside-diphosphate-sugar epimerase